MRFLASVVSQSFLAFGDILELHKKFAELSGSINRIFELEELLDAAQSGTSFFTLLSIALLFHVPLVQKKRDEKFVFMLFYKQVNKTACYRQHDKLWKEHTQVELQK